MRTSFDWEGKVSLRRVAAFPVISLLIQFAGQTLCLLGHWRRHQPVIVVVAAFLYVLAGLCLFIGIIIYIGAVTGEASNRPKSGDEPKFISSYGPSLALTFISFIACELTAVLAVHLYISRNRRVKPVVAPSPAAAEVDLVPPSNGRAPRGAFTELDSSPRRELQSLNDWRPPQSNCSSPSVIALQSAKSWRHDVMASRTLTSADVNHRGGGVKRQRHDVPDYYSPVDRRHELFSPSRACVSLSNVRSIDDLDPFKRITPV